MASSTPPLSPSALLDALRASSHRQVRLAVADIDGVLRGKYVSLDKFLSAAKPPPDGGLGFCDVIFGWDCHDQTYHAGESANGQEGFPDAIARVDLSTYRQVPWNQQVPFFLGDFVLPGEQPGAPERPHPLCPRQLLKRVLARGEKLGLRAKCGMEFEWFNFAETPQSWADKGYSQPRPITPGMFGYSILRAAHGREFMAALLDELPRFGIPIEGLHTETGPGVYEVAIEFSDALEAADRAVLCKTAVKEIALRFGIMPSFMAKWNAQYPGCSGHIHQSLFEGETNIFHDPAGRHGMSARFESYVAGQVAALLEFAPLFWPTINSYKRLVDGFWAPVKPTWAVDNRIASYRVIPGSAKSTRLETRSPGSDVNPYLAMAAVVAAGLHGIEQGLKLTTPPIRGSNQGAEDVPRAPRTLAETTRVFRSSALARDWFGDAFVDHYATTREWETRLWRDAVTDWELKRYFEII